MFIQSLFLSLVITFLTKTNVVNEVAPTELKGQLGTLHQLMVTTGIMVPGLMGLGMVRFDPASGDKTPCIYQTQNCSPSNTEGFAALNYWRVFFSLPIAFAVI